MCKEESMLPCSSEKLSMRENIGRIFRGNYDIIGFHDYTQHEQSFLENLMDLRSRFENEERIPNNNEYKNIFVVYHYADIDGHNINVINGLLNKGDISNSFGCNIRADEAYDIIKQKIEEGYFIIIADLNFTEKCAKKVNDELDTSKIILLDHHDSANYMNQYTWAFVRSHDEENLYLSSGTLLFTMFLFAAFGNNKDLKDHTIIIDLAMSTALYDTWFWASNFDYTRELSEKWFGDYPEDLCMLFKSMNKDKYAQYVLDNINNREICNVFNKEDKLQIKFMRTITRKTIDRYYHNMRIAEANGKKIAVVYGNDEVSAVGNFILKTHKDISYFVMIDLNRNAISLRSRNDYNVKEIAIRNPKGGGHAQSAGFSIEKEVGHDVFWQYLLKYLEVGKVYKIFDGIECIQDIAEFDSDKKVYKFK